eukprot:CCRYP_000364-RA/>CCRYP_000364-RA protein AED:0.23 eAED:0.23 QI:178/1/1/1/1/1/3/52/755
MKQHSEYRRRRSQRFQPTLRLFIAVTVIISCLSISLTHAFLSVLQTKRANNRLVSDNVFASYNAPYRGRRRTFQAREAVQSDNDTADYPTTRSQLEKMTLKQLKELMLELGIPSRPGNKLKKDVVDYIWDCVNSELMASSDLVKNLMGEDGSEKEKFPGLNGIKQSHDAVSDDLPTSSTNNAPKRKKPGNMPPLSVNTVPDDEEDEEIDHNETPYVLTPKDRIVLDVLERYPPLHDAIIAACAASTDNEVTGGFTNSNRGIESITTSNIDQCSLSTLLYHPPSGLAENDMRQTYHPMLRNTTQSDLDIVFVGTASCTPGITRGVSCTAVRLNWRSSRVYNTANGDVRSEREEDKGSMGTWLFDCGEATQLSIQKTSSIKPGKVSKIFITHCHGDHSFGLPGLLCLMGTDRDRDAPPVEIYGPEGLRMWLRVAIRYSVSRIVPPYRVHELMDVPMAPEWEQGHRRNGRFYFQWKKEGGGHRWGTKGLAGEDPVSWISRAPMINLDPSMDFGEVKGGRDIYPRYDHPQCHDGAPIWEVENDGEVSVYAAPMSHGVPCVGYVIEEHDRPGRLRPENVLSVIERNRDGLISSGVKNPMKVMAVVKNLPVGGTYTFPDGTIIKQEDVVEPPRKGRKLVICGDTADCRALEGLSQGADVLVHEATNTFLHGVDKDGNMRMVTRDAKIHGHSTPLMAGEFAKRINAKKLVLNHFSARYKGDQSLDSITIMTRMERQAMKASGLAEDAVACAWDFMLLPVPRN